MEMLAMLGPILVMLTTIIPIAIAIIAIVIVVRYIKKSDKRADQKLKLEKENIVFQRKMMDEMNQRLINIEKILKDIE